MCRRVPVADFCAPGAHESMTNLRRDPRHPAMLRPVGEPRQVSDSGALPVASFEISGRRVVFWADGVRLWVEVCREPLPSAGDFHSAASRKFLGTLPAEPLLLQHTAPGVVRILLRHAAPVYVAYDQAFDFTLAGQVPQLPGVTLSITSVETLRGTIPARKLTGIAGHAPGPLEAADALVMRQAGLDGYRSLKALAARTGRFLQPVLARYRVVDAAGDTLVCGPWVMPSAPEGFQCVGQLSVSADADTGQTAQGAVEGRGYLLHVSAPEAVDGPWRRLAAKLLVEVSDEIEPVDFSDEAAASASGNIEADPRGVLSVKWYLPGCTAEKLSKPGRRAPLVVKALGEAARSVRVAAEIDFPFEGRGAVIAGAPGADMPLEPAVADEPLLHRESYSAVAEDGELLLLANPRREASPGLPACAFVIDSAASAVSPLLTVADRRATRLTVAYADADGATHVRNFPLTPLAGADMAYWLSTTLATPTPGGGRVLSVSADVAEASVTDGEVVCMRVSEPGAEVSRRLCCGHPVCCLMPMPRAGGGWDFSRQKFLAFTPGGIWQLTVSAQGGIVGTTMIDRRGVADASAVTWGLDTAGGPCVYASAGSDIVAVGSRTTKTVVAGEAASALGWCGRYGELWMRRGSGLFRLTRHNEVVGVLADIFPGGDVRFCPWDGALLVEAGGALYNADSEGAPAQTRCRLKGRAALPAGVAAPLWLDVRVFAAEATGTLAVCGDDGSGVESPLMRVGVRGALDAPLLLPVAAPRRGYVSVELDMRLSPDARLDAVGVIARRYAGR